MIYRDFLIFPEVKLPKQPFSEKLTLKHENI